LGRCQRSFKCTVDDKCTSVLKLIGVTGVLEEAEFYNVADLVALVQQHIADRDARKNQV